MRLLAAMSIALTAGCSLTVDDESPGEAPETAQGALVQGALIVDQMVSAGAPQTRVSARFVRVSGNIDHAIAEQVIGAPRFDTASSLGCRVLEREEPVVASGGSIELLDVGELVVHVLGDEPTILPLAARAFPDLGDLVSGVVYTSRDGAHAVPAGGRFLIETTGSSQLDGFSLRVDAPEAPSGVTFGDLEDLLLVGEPIAIGWNAGQPAEGDRVYVDITPADPDALDARTVRCVFDDDGQAVIPWAALALPAETLVDIELHRHRRALARLEAIDEAVVDFDFAVAARLLVADYTVP